MVSHKDPRLELAGEYTITVEHKNFVKLKEVQLFNFVIKLMKPLAYQLLVRDEKPREVLVLNYWCL